MNRRTRAASRTPTKPARTTDIEHLALDPDMNEVRDALQNVQRLLGRESNSHVEYQAREELFDAFYRGQRGSHLAEKPKQLHSRHAASIERFEEMENQRQKKLEAKRLEKLMAEEANMSEVPLINTNIKAKSQFKQATRSSKKIGITSRAKQLEQENLRECTFKPDLSATRKRAGSKSREPSEDPSISDFYGDKGRTPSQLLEWGEEKESKLAQLRLLHANDENTVTQNVPKINSKSKQMVGILNLS